MMLNLWNINKLFTWLEGKMIGGTIAYSSGIIINILSDVKSTTAFLHICTNFTRPAIFLMWLFIGCTIIVVLLSRALRYLTKKQSPSTEFREIMTNHTDRLLGIIGQNELSWGFNKNIHRSKDPAGWQPDVFYISSYQDNEEYQFPLLNEELPGYTREKFYQYSLSDKMQSCIRRGNNKERFSVLNIVPNYNSNDRKVEIKILKTRWVPLQFSWNYFRRLDENNQPIPDKTNIEQITNSMAKVFLDHNQANEYMINSFCLHLILETKDGKAILAKISRNKSNDYPSTWAATLGEQLEKSDFYDSQTNSTYNDFVMRWVKRALLEEFDITDMPKYGPDSEFDEFVDKKSLRVLSIDFEGDIYNIAITCVIKLRVSFNGFIDTKGIWADSEESTEFKACNLQEIRDILLNYPNNSKEYHPSTYLRLLMFHLYKSGTSELCKSISKDFRNKNK